MITQRTLNQIKDLHKKISEEGFQQLKNHTSQFEIPQSPIVLPKALVDAKTRSNPIVFRYFVLEAFWRLYSLVRLSIENPLVQFSWRPLFELCYGKIIYFGLQSELEQKDAATKYWLIRDALMLGGKRRKDIKTQKKYGYSIDELRKTDEQAFFKRMQKEDFPQEDLFRMSGRNFLHPSLNNERLLKQIEPYFVKVWDVDYSKDYKDYKDYIKTLFSWLSEYMHADIIFMMGVKNQESNKDYIIKCALVLFCTGYHVLNFVDKKIFDNKNINQKFEGLRKEIEDFVRDYKISKIFSKLFT